MWSDVIWRMPLCLGQWLGHTEGPSPAQRACSGVRLLAGSVSLGPWLEGLEPHSASSSDITHRFSLILFLH